MAADTELMVTFYRDGHYPETMIARDGANAWEHALYLITQRETLQHGDALRVRLRSKSGPIPGLLGATDDA